MTQLAALLLSFAVEGVTAGGLVRGLRWGPAWRAALAAVFGTLATHPVVWPLMIDLMWRMNYWLALLLVESGVAVVETLGYRYLAGLPWRRALTASIVANAASTAAGLLIYAARSL